MVRTLRRFESVQRIDLTRHFIYYAICKSLSKRINKEIPTLSLPLLWGRSPPTRNRCDRYGKAEPVPTEKGEMRVRSKDDSPDERKRRDDVTGRQVRTPTWHLLPFGSRHVADVETSPGRERWDLRSTRGLSGHEATRDAGSHVREHDWWKACGTRGSTQVPSDWPLNAGFSYERLVGILLPGHGLSSPWQQLQIWCTGHVWNRTGPHHIKPPFVCVCRGGGLVYLGIRMNSSNIMSRWIKCSDYRPLIATLSSVGPGYFSFMVRGGNR